MPQKRQFRENARPGKYIPTWNIPMRNRTFRQNSSLSCTFPLNLKYIRNGNILKGCPWAKSRPRPKNSTPPSGGRKSSAPASFAASIIDSSILSIAVDTKITGCAMQSEATRTPISGIVNRISDNHSIGLIPNNAQIDAEIPYVLLNIFFQTIANMISLVTAGKYNMIFVAFLNPNY